ncbi:YjzD family protein [Heyndrickxia acidiproducens]|jgi:hypothetical protein|uniref:YjzD family protein n=1 Tax=Heyndrickxia acidiproducens TaxID=1121084 RepID=UPI00037E060E|nr:YjzD family protein [Heyndrickxia acidiproducens]
MKYFFTLFWVFLLTQMLGYVGSSMTGTTYSVKTMAVVSLVLTVLIFIVDAILPKHVSVKE